MLQYHEFYIYPAHEHHYLHQISFDLILKYSTTTTTLSKNKVDNNDLSLWKWTSKITRLVTWIVLTIKPYAGVVDSHEKEKVFLGTFCCHMSWAELSHHFQVPQKYSYTQSKFLHAFFCWCEPSYCVSHNFPICDLLRYIM